LVSKGDSVTLISKGCLRSISMADIEKVLSPPKRRAPEGGMGGDAVALTSKSNDGSGKKR
jgi:hypothetical protein